MAALSVAERLDLYIERTDTCWMWTGAKSTDGYGMGWANGKTRLIHRVLYELHVGDIPEGLHLDHLCRERLCVNPWHLEPVTCRTNVLRGVGITAENARKTHCKHGHPFSEANTYIYRGHRYCRACDAAKHRAAAAKRRAVIDGRAVPKADR